MGGCDKDPRMRSSASSLIPESSRGRSQPGIGEDWAKKQERVSYSKHICALTRRRNLETMWLRARTTLWFSHFDMTHSLCFLQLPLPCVRCFITLIVAGFPVCDLFIPVRPTAVQSDCYSLLRTFPYRELLGDFLLPSGWRPNTELDFSGSGGSGFLITASPLSRYFPLPFSS